MIANEIDGRNINTRVSPDKDELFSALLMSKIPTKPQRRHLRAMAQSQFPDPIAIGPIDNEAVNDTDRQNGRSHCFLPLPSEVGVLLVVRLSRAGVSGGSPGVIARC